MKSLSDISVTSLKGVGAKIAQKLERLGLVTLQDVIFHLPIRYEDRTRIYPIADLLPLTHVSVQGTILSVDIKYGRKRMLLVNIADQTGSLTLRFFHFSAAQARYLTVGSILRAFGEVRTGKSHFEMMHPEYRVIEDPKNTILEDSLTPVYPTTEGIKQLTLRNLTAQTLELLEENSLPDLLPDGLYNDQLTLAGALALVHRPSPEVQIDLLSKGVHPAQKRLVIEELIAHNLGVLRARSSVQSERGMSITIDTKFKSRFLSTLPFSPTHAQLRVVDEIESDIQQTFPMMRLVQGDVGSGKTLVAALAALSVIRQGMQVALMAPTELLAEQHAQNFAAWLEPLGIRVGWLAGKVKGKIRQHTLDSLKSGEIDILIGTHAIFQESVTYNSLALVIVDEQHRFGVHQRLSLRNKGDANGKYPHQLVMTATPIPRTLAMTAYADLDTSIIDELPPGRTAVKTVVVPDTRRAEVIERVRSAVMESNRQVYWVCTLIDESEVLQCQAAEDTAVALCNALPHLKIGLVHGRLKPAEKQEVMNAFKNGNLDIIVATTVIEVGVDVPNASLMIIENPERLGLAQLHQLRGRVGRGSIESHCVLMYQHPLSKTANQRLQVLRESNDGFYIAEKDLEIRGPGELLGTKQTGIAELKIADLTRDAHLIPEVKTLAEHLWLHHPKQANLIIERWLAYREDFGHA